MAQYSTVQSLGLFSRVPTLNVPSDCAPTALPGTGVSKSSRGLLHGSCRNDRAPTSKCTHSQHNTQGIPQRTGRYPWPSSSSSSSTTTTIPFRSLYRYRPAPPRTSNGQTPTHHGRRGTVSGSREKALFQAVAKRHFFRQSRKGTFSAHTPLANLEGIDRKRLENSRMAARGSTTRARPAQNPAAPSHFVSPMCWQSALECSRSR
jgi:hypothetical protein